MLSMHKLIIGPITLPAIESASIEIVRSAISIEADSIAGRVMGPFISLCIDNIIPQLLSKFHLCLVVSVQML